MARNDEGEFELVLGNKQLLSVFFILVVLLGVFFTMGYIVGRNNPSNDAVNMAMARRPADPNGSKPKEVDADTPSTPATQPKIIDTPKPEPVKEVPPPVKKDEPKKEERKKAEVKKEEKKDTPKPKEVPPPVKAEPVRSAGGIVPVPRAGSYLQVAAIDEKGAAILSDSLRKKSFPAIVTPGPNGLFRVVVGPLGSPEEVSRTRTRLEEVGIKGSMPRKYKGE